VHPSQLPPANRAGREELIRFLASVLKDVAEPRGITFCARFRYSTKRRKPVFELPFDLVTAKDGPRWAEGARVEGLRLSFEGPQTPLDRIDLTVTGVPPRYLWITLRASEKFALGESPIEAVYKRAARLADLFAQEAGEA
jgi:hypothetical protein